MIKVSVVVPVYNPGIAFDACVASLLGQSMAAGECELVFVDDGSTDGTGERLDALAAQHEHVRVRHIPNSGWPGRPRNVGIEMARGEFLYFVDNDDRLGPEALERLHAMAIADGADIVIGKVVGHGKTVPRPLFVRNEHDLDARTVSFGLLSPHKLFRRALLEEHELRFPEGPRRLEDHFMVVPAFFKARRIAILSDYPCYHWIAPEDKTNLSFQAPDPAEYFASVADVLDIVDAHTEAGPFRDGLYVRWYRGKLLARVGDWLRAPDTDADFHARVVDAARRLAEDRFSPALDARLPYLTAQRARLLRDGDVGRLAALSRLERVMRSSARITRLRGDGTWLTLRMTGRLRLEDGTPLTVRRERDRLMLVPAGPIAEALTDEHLDVTDRLDDGEVVVFLKSLDDGIEWVIPADVTLRVPDAPDGEVVRPTLGIQVRIAPTIAAGGGPLPPGSYDLRVVVSMGGLRFTSRVRRDSEVFAITVTPAHRLEHWRPPARPRPPAPAPRATPQPALTRVRRGAALAAHEVPGLVPALRRARRRLAAP